MQLEAAPEDGVELDTRERLVRAAIAVFLEKGYGGSRVQDIARKAGYTAGALYVHFPSRTALLGEAIVLEGRAIIDALIARFTDITPGSGAVSRVLADFTVAESGPIDLLLLEALALASRDAEAREMLASTLHDLETAMQSQIEKAMGLGVLDPTLDVDAIRTFFSAWILGLIVHRAVGLRGADTDAVFEVCQRVTQGISPE